MEGVKDVLLDGSRLKVIPLLQAFLFPEELSVRSSSSSSGGGGN